MKAKEKQLLHSFFLTASGAIEGFKTREKNEEPKFFDDEVPCENKKENSCPLSLSSFVSDPLSSPPSKALTTYSSLQALKADIELCTLCPLAKTRRNIVAGEGPQELSKAGNAPSILVIGEAPGQEEDESSRPFVGNAGKLLDKMLAAIELSRHTNCFITNMVKCRPPENRNPTTEEITSCSHFLQEQIRLISPKMILLLGTVALKAMFKTTEGIMHLHGRLMHYSLSKENSIESGNPSPTKILIPTIPTFHPSALLRNESLKRPAWDDLKFFKTKLKEIIG